MSRFRIISQLGAGGFGEAFRAWDSQQGMPVVLKRPLAKHLHRPDIRERFDREIARLLECDHPHIVPIIAHGHDPDGLPYLAMRFLPAGSLADRKKPQSLSFLHRWLPAVAEALDYVHARGIVHRDVKPANIFFDTQTVAYLGDFGIAKVVDEDLAGESEQSLTATGGEIGTYPYMGPEFFGQPRVLSGAYDQYALAVTVYEMICGRRPFTGDSSQLIVAHVTQDPPDIRQFQADAPETVCHALSRALAKKPLDRFSTCSSFAQAVLQDVPPAQVVDSHHRFVCPGCHSLVRVPADFGGRRCRCRECNASLRASDSLDALWLVQEAPPESHNKQRIPLKRDDLDHKTQSESSSHARRSNQKPAGDSLSAESTLVPPCEVNSNGRARGAELVNSLGMGFTRIPVGTFMMGQSSDVLDEKPHKVAITTPYYIGTYEVTNAQWKSIMGDVPSEWAGEDKNPVERVTWYEAVEFCNRLSNTTEEKLAGRVYRLPTEAEWEYACRAGTDTTYAFGDDESLLEEHGWFQGNSDDCAFLIRQPHPVGRKKPNAWGLYDMHGNVYEWCSDWYGDYEWYPVTDPQGPPHGEDKICRGGAYWGTAWDCRSAQRGRQDPLCPSGSIGLRIACTTRTNASSDSLSVQRIISDRSLVAEKQACTGQLPQRPPNQARQTRFRSLKIFAAVITVVALLHCAAALNNQQYLLPEYFILIDLPVVIFGSTLLSQFRVDDWRQFFRDLYRAIAQDW